MTAANGHPGAPGASALSVTVEELALAWRAVRSGEFRAHPQPANPRQAPGHGTGDWASVDEAAELDAGPVLAVVGAHGWSGASTTALLIAEAAARRGRRVRLLDLAAPARSGLAAASVTEQGVDETGRWRQGSRGAVAVHRLADPVTWLSGVAAPLAVPAPTVSVLDVGWPVPDLLELMERGRADRHWLGPLVGSAALVLTARATIPGLRHAEASLAALVGLRGARGRIVLALLGPGTLPRTLTAWAGQAVAAAHRDQLLVAVRECSGLTRTGLTPAALPRVLQPAGEALLDLTCPAETPAPEPGTRPRRRLLPQRATTRKDEQQ